MSEHLVKLCSTAMFSWGMISGSRTIYQRRKEENLAFLMYTQLMLTSVGVSGEQGVQDWAPFYLKGLNLINSRYKVQIYHIL